MKSKLCRSAKSCSFGSCWSKNSSVEAVWEDRGERKHFVGLKKVTVLHNYWQKGKAGVHAGCVSPERRMLTPNWGHTVYCQVESFVHKNKLTKLVREKKNFQEISWNTLSSSSTCPTRCFRKEHQSLEDPIEDDARHDLVRTEAEEAKCKDDCKWQDVCIANQCIKASQTNKRDISELILQMQKAHEDLKKCTAKLKSSVGYTEQDEKEHYKTAGTLKRAIMDLRVKCSGNM